MDSKHKISSSPAIGEMQIKTARYYFCPFFCQIGWKFVTSDNLQIENTLVNISYTMRLKMLYSTPHLLVATMQILYFWQIEGSWLSFVKKIYKSHFSSSICSLHVSMSPFGNSAMFHTFSLSYLLCDLCDQWSLMLLLPKITIRQSFRMIQHF